MTAARLICCAILATLPAAAQLRRGDAAPHFVAHTVDGEKLTTESLKGKVVLIEFWATWCKYCKSDEPALQAIDKEFTDKGLVLIAVDMGEPKRKVKKFLDETPKAGKVVLADDTTLAAICNAKSYPLYVLIDRDGTVAGVRNGAGGLDSLHDLLGDAGLQAEH